MVLAMVARPFGLDVLPIKENLPLERFALPAEKAKELMAGQPYKEELIEEHAGKGEDISFYKHTAQASTPIYSL